MFYTYYIGIYIPKAMICVSSINYIIKDNYNSYNLQISYKAIYYIAYHKAI